MLQSVTQTSETDLLEEAPTVGILKYTSRKEALTSS